MALLKIDRNPPERLLRQFACILPPFSLVLGALMIWRHGWWIAAAVIVAVLTIVGVVGILRPRAMRPVFVGWIYLTFPIAFVISHTILAFTYFLVITPIGWLVRAMGKDPLKLKKDPAAATYWEPREEPADRSRYFRQF